jgi:Raf kinase inhibitor-like YbhB/YbcL family protein
VDFFHWVLVDIPVCLKSFPEGMFSDMVTPHGKDGPQVPFTIKNGTEHQLRHGINDYTGWFADNPDMAGEYYGYDGPCPPWNDERVHTYIFALYALDIPRLPLIGRFSGAELRLAIRGHILDEALTFGAGLAGAINDITPPRGSGERTSCFLITTALQAPRPPFS